MDVSGFALITGAASGIGRACARAFAIEGSAGVALLDINEEALITVKTDIEAEIVKRKSGTGADNGRPCRILIYSLDVSSEEQVDRVISEVAEAFGRLDYVVNGAGVAVTHDGGTAAVKTNDWNRVIDINLTGTFFVLRAAAQIMLKQEPILSSIDGRPLQRGSIVNVASILGIVGSPTTTAYAASKHAVIGLTQTAALDHAKDGLRINAICPGYVETPMTTNDSVKKPIEHVVSTAVPMCRFGQPKEIADGILFLAGGRSSFVTGSALMVDGGYTSR